MFRTRRLKNGNLHTPNIIREDALEKVSVPNQEKVVVKTVPARCGDEVVGEAVIYEDGTIDIIKFGDISPEAEAYIHSFQSAMLGIDGDEETDGSA